ncbi:MAG: hypothetical protein QS748_05405 [Candidatus Endonucleobacter bathymodioli]|uniref:Uncharacterized protein n=1 Tax=Candidatus Endonucleibacter bathymodioli TaxID=539814 RepID=A0AA90NUW8_9GAMM|nr:hypothetical protein [Candidatus Endonucleobacter bathymodioli]
MSFRSYAKKTRIQIRSASLNQVEEGPAEGKLLPFFSGKRLSDDENLPTTDLQTTMPDFGPEEKRLQPKNDR